MRFLSTRSNEFVNSGAEAIVKGLCLDGGLFVPEKFPNLSGELNSMLDMDYAERACKVIHSFLTEYDQEDLLNACVEAYARFDENDAAPVVKLDDNLYVLELFHGPTLAFKDIALTLLPYLLRKGADICGVKDEILIMVATSGDTGKAALEGFKDAKGIKISVFYPSDGVSDMQKLQMCTQEGSNVNVVGVNGNFDDCQTAVKNIFSNKQISEELKQNGVILSSANSINFGRLVPQISYYFSAYLDIVNSGAINLGDEIDFCVPTGNFGNILAGYYAKKMGLPIRKLICASNVNNVLTDFFDKGSYDINREFYKTMSPSMDILISSNLERLIFEMSGRDFNLTAKRMAELKKDGKYEISDIERKKIQKEFSAYYTSEAECLDVIGDFFDEYGYVLDTHTAVAMKGTLDYLDKTESEKPIVVLSTASPYKFAKDVLMGLTGVEEKDAFKASNKIYSETAFPIPDQISELKTKVKRFNQVVDKDGVYQAIEKFLSK